MRGKKGGEGRVRREEGWAASEGYKREMRISIGGDCSESKERASGRQRQQDENSELW